MKSLCIKTNNNQSLNYLLDSFEHINQNNVCFSSNSFKLYKNVIIHYTGDDINLFIANVSSTLSFLIINLYEEKILQNLLYINYFYFDLIEQKKVLDICFEILTDEKEFSLTNRQQLLFNNFYEYININKNIFLDGFITFRLKNYIEFLDSVLDIAVNKFIVEREYLEFVSLLKVYINSQDSNAEFVHLVYTDTQSILLDKHKNLINLNKDILNSKYLSDISFSANDYTLNSLLTLLPEKIYIHLINNKIDEFINTLQLIFENKIQICTDCYICKLYKNKANSK